MDFKRCKALFFNGRERTKAWYNDRLEWSKMSKSISIDHAKTTEKTDGVYEKEKGRFIV